MWRNRVDLGHPDGSWDIWSDGPAPQKVITVAGSAVFARDVAGLVRMLAMQGKSGWAGTASGGLRQEISGLRPPFPVSASPMRTPDSGMRTKPATSRAKLWGAGPLAGYVTAGVLYSVAWLRGAPAQRRGPG
jgi:hypothetical protein